METNVMVSIICNTYNHGKYIRDTLDSFIKQVTNFPFEVLIHDDASTDNTAVIIKEYETKYPRIIKPIYQKENQYSKSFSLIEEYQYSRVKGKYIALCEGDDYWTDEYKLQKQFDLLEAHPEVDMCAHAAYKICEGRIVGKVSPKDKICKISTDEVILGGGGYFATNSLFYRTEMRRFKPKFIEELRLDYFVQIWGSLRGGILFIPDYMSCYRVGVPGSWTHRMQSNTKARIDHINRVNQVLLVLNEETKGKYCKAIEAHIAENEFGVLEIEHRYSEMKRSKYKNIYNELPLNKKIRINIKQILWYIGINK